MPTNQNQRADRPSQYNQVRTPAVLAAVCDMVAETGNLSSAARAVGVIPETVYLWRRRSEDNPDDPEMRVMLADLAERPFHEALALALDRSCDKLEETARMLATGYREPVVYQGEIPWRRNADGSLYIDPETMLPEPLTVVKYSEQMLKTLLGAHRSARFRENRSVDLKATVSGGVLVVGEAAKTEQEYVDSPSRKDACSS